MSSGSKLEASPSTGTGVAKPVNVSQNPFQLQRTGAKVLFMICVHVAGPAYGHMIQSKHPVPPTAPNENSRVPVVATFTTIHVLFNSPDNRHPELRVVPKLGFVCGFEMELSVLNSTTFPEPLGSI